MLARDAKQFFNFFLTGDLGTLGSKKSQDPIELVLVGGGCVDLHNGTDAVAEGVEHLWAVTLCAQQGGRCRGDGGLETHQTVGINFNVEAGRRRNFLVLAALFLAGAEIFARFWSGIVGAAIFRVGLSRR